MARVTYTDLERAAPYVAVNGIEFSHGVPVDVSDGDSETLALVSRNRWFKVENWKHDGDEDQATEPEPTLEDAKQQAAYAKGAQAWAEARDRRAPSRWQAYEQAWLRGYDDASGRPVP